MMKYNIYKCEFILDNGTYTRNMIKYVLSKYLTDEATILKLLNDELYSDDKESYIVKSSLKITSVNTEDNFMILD